MVEFGERMRVMRAARNMSQEELARVSGIPRTYLSKAESGRWVLTVEEEIALRAALDWGEQEDAALDVLASEAETEAA